MTQRRTLSRAMRPMKDHSLKAYGDDVCAYVPKEYMERIQAEVQRAGIDDPQQVADELEWGSMWFRGDEATKVSCPRPADERKSLESFIERSELFLDALERLSQVSRRRILDAGKGSPLRYPKADPMLLVPNVKALISRSRVALTSIKSDKGGVKPRSAMRTLLLKIAVIWFRQFPNRAGVTRSGQRKSGERYAGPLLDFAASVLPLLDVPFNSHDSLGSDLVSIAPRAKKIAAQPLPAESVVQHVPRSLGEILADAHKKPRRPIN